MFKKLRIKFIALIMASVAVVLALMFTFICVNEHRSSVAEVDEALDSALRVAQIDNGFRPEMLDGTEGDASFMSVPPSSSSSAISSTSSSSSFSSSYDMSRGYSFDSRHQDGYSDAAQPPRIGGRDDRAFNSLVPVATYAITLDDNVIAPVPRATSASISDDVLDQAMQEALASSSQRGTLNNLGLYYSKESRDGGVFVSFADTTYLDGWKSLALSLSLGGACVLLVFFILSLFFSNWALKPVREAWDSQRQFIADASHELKTPLTVVLANSSILLKHPDQSIASQSQWIESTQIEAENMQQLVNEMLQLAQVEERAALVLEPLDFSDLVDGEVLQFESVAFEEGIDFDCQIDEGISVAGDSTRLRKMTSTLIENALKYAGDDGRATITLARKGKVAVLSTNNTGSVISAEDLPHIFDRFYRTDKARTSGAGGFGLGLAIAREIARAHGGDITCTSSVEAGTTFTVTLPLASA